MASPALIISIDGKEYRLRPSQLTAIDAKDFRNVTGQKLIDVVRRGPTELDEAAGLVWLVRRKREPGLPFEAVAIAMNYDSDLKVEHRGADASPPAPADEDDEDPTDPET